MDAQLWFTVVIPGQGLVLGAHVFLQLMRQLPVVQGLAAGRVPVYQRRLDNAGAVVVGDQSAHLAGAQDVLSQLFHGPGGTVVMRVDDLVTLEALLGDLDPAYIRGPQGAHAVAIDTGQVKHLVIDFLQQVQVLRVKNIAAGVFHRDLDGGPRGPQVCRVLHEGADEGVLHGNHLLEAGVRAQLGDLVGKKHGSQQEHYQQGGAVVEDQALEYALFLAGVVSVRGCLPGLVLVSHCRLQRAPCASLLPDPPAPAVRPAAGPHSG